MVLKRKDKKAQFSSTLIVILAVIIGGVVVIFGYNIIKDNININNAKNDCADFSFGQYKINKLNLSNCGDKSLSVGEKSQMKIDSINVNNSNFGIASKDSSIVSFFEGNFDTVNYCLAAYNKKQEFFGGLIKFDNLQCNNYQVYFDVDLKSKILKKNMELN